MLDKPSFNNSKRKIEPFLSKDSSKAQKKNKRSSIITKPALILQSDHVEKRKSRVFLETMEVFDWESFKRNPNFTFFEDPACMELITQNQLLEVCDIYKT